MPRRRFGAFLAPHHPVGEHPMLQFRRDLDLVELLDKLGYDEFWCGEHHSSGWEMIASPEMFLAARESAPGASNWRPASCRCPTSSIQRRPTMVQLDHMTGGRAIFGSGPGALVPDARTLGVDPMVLRDRQDEAIGIIRRLFNGEHVTARSEWFTLQDAALQLLPLQEEMPFAVASQISPSGMTLAGKHGIGIISIGSLSEEGLDALPTQWGFAESAAAQHGKTVDRKNWRVLLSCISPRHAKRRGRRPRDGSRFDTIMNISPARCSASARSRSRPPTRRWTRQRSRRGLCPRSEHRTISSNGSNRFLSSAAGSALWSVSCATGPIRPATYCPMRPGQQPTLGAHLTSASRRPSSARTFPPRQEQVAQIERRQSAERRHRQTSRQDGAAADHQAMDADASRDPSHRDAAEAAAFA